ncbi:MAG: mechanosensitive ion channel family protein [Endomicrobium sp.]|jgi:small-conductance mechanosensitive channel|nr:mechanosensitive ion channel family protein [Endomicrobium sp.]
MTLWIESAFLFVLIFSAGVFFNRYVARFIQTILSKIGLILRDEMIAMSNSYISFWSFLIALYAASLKAPINNTSGVAYKLFCGVFVFSVVVLVASIISKFFQKSVHEKIGSNLIKFSVIFVGLILILNQVGIKLTPILTALGIGSLAVALALQDTLANFFAGINILTSRQIVRGDYVKLDSGYEGTIIEVNWRTTLIREISNVVITVPNNKISSAIITSFHFNMAEVTVSIDCGVAYGSDLEYVEKIAILAAQEAIDKCEDSVKTYTPIVRFISFADSSVKFVLIFRVKNIYAKPFVQSEVFKNLYKKLNEEKIEIPFPQRVIILNKHKQ